MPCAQRGPAGRSERGLALSSPLAVASVAAVVLAGIAFVATDGSRPEREPTRPAAVSTPASSPPVASATPRARTSRPAAKPAVRRGETYVEVYNNSGISGLAGSVAARAQGAGWQVVGSDNWYGTIDASTVYFPARLRREARLLGKDLGIARVKPAIDPMRGDRLTVILTADYA
ncbi:MAG: LytR C-terminal domain-containing protein [Nocardioidaceae bacterium]